MNVLSLGASQNIGYYTALRLLKQGANVTFLLRRPSVFDNDADIQPYIKSGKARLVPGDALKADDVRKVWQSALDAGQGIVDLVIFTLGGKPNFSLSRGVYMDPADLCTRSLLTLLTTIPDALRVPDAQPRFVCVTSNGILPESHAKIPFAIRPIYTYMLPAPHADKFGMERVLAHCTGTPWTAGKEPQSEILPEGWRDTPGLFREGEMKHLVIIQPAMLTDGKCRGDEVEAEGKGKAPYRTTVTDEFTDAYRVSRQDVGHFIAQDVVPNWSKWEGKSVVVAY